MFAVDVRAASTTTYVHASLVAALRRAAALGFGTRRPGIFFALQMFLMHFKATLSRSFFGNASAANS